MSKQMVHRTDWARVRMADRECTEEAIRRYVREHPKARATGFLLSEVEDWIEKKFGRRAWTEQICFGRGDKAHQEMVFDSGMVYEDLQKNLKKTAGGERLYLCVDQQVGRGEHLFKPVDYLTAEDWDIQEQAHEARRASALRERKLSHGRAEYMRQNDIHYYKDVPASVRESFRTGVGLAV